MTLVVSIDCKSLRACLTVIAGVLPSTTEYRSVRTDRAGFKAIACRVTMPSKKCRSAASTCFLLAVDNVKLSGGTYGTHALMRTYGGTYGAIHL